MTGREIIQALHDGRYVFASAIVGMSPLWPELAKKTGIDFVFVDTEHIPLDRQTLSWICQTYQALGLPPVVRIPSNDPFEACKALDAGAGGIIGPYLETADQLRGLVGAVKLRPLKGKRLAEALRDRKTLEPELADYLAKRNGEKILIANIESVPAIENLREICAVSGLDAVLIGPHDLTCSLGIPEQYDHPRFDEAVRTIFRIAREHGVGAGIHFWLGLEQEIAWAKASGNLVMHSSDLAAFSRTLQAEFKQLREALRS
ncbi:MAG: aldolase/citrate lyase family protein [Planctomycetia bacterium]|nr:aldolase/citrate lyase family protein [Planctomycetia bacterium]